MPAIDNTFRVAAGSPLPASALLEPAVPHAGAPPPSGPELAAFEQFLSRHHQQLGGTNGVVLPPGADPIPLRRFQLFLAQYEGPIDLRDGIDLREFQYAVERWRAAQDELNGPAKTAAAAGGLATVAAIAAWTSQGIGWTKSWGLDRGRLAVATALKGKALVAANPDMARGARVRAYITGSTDVTGPVKVLRDALIGPTTSTVPVQGGLLRVPFTQTHVQDGWGKAFRTSSKLGLVGSVAVAASGTLNAYSGYQQDGWGGLLSTKEGRMGALQLLGTAWGTSFNIMAMSHRDAGQSAAQAFVGSSWLMDPKVRSIKYAVGSALGLLATVNLFGGFDRFDG